MAILIVYLSLFFIWIFIVTSQSHAEILKQSQFNPYVQPPLMNDLCYIVHTYTEKGKSGPLEIITFYADTVLCPFFYNQAVSRKKKALEVFAVSHQI